MYKKVPFLKNVRMICSIWLFFTVGLALAGSADIDAGSKINDSRISANLKDVRLAVIRGILEKEKGIEIISPTVLLNEKITVAFTDLSIEEGLRRILASFNYSLIFNEEEEITGAMIIDSVDKSQHQMQRKFKKPEKKFEMVNAQYKQENTGNHGPFQIIPNSFPPENQFAEPIDTIIRNNSTPPE
jgi:hypothetical protein